MGMPESVSCRLMVTVQFDTPLEHDDKDGEKTSTFFPMDALATEVELRIISLLEFL